MGGDRDLASAGVPRLIPDNPRVEKDAENAPLTQNVGRRRNGQYMTNGIFELTFGLG